MRVMVVASALWVVGRPGGNAIESPSIIQYLQNNANVEHQLVLNFLLIITFIVKVYCDQLANAGDHDEFSSTKKIKTSQNDKQGKDEEASHVDNQWNDDGASEVDMQENDDEATQVDKQEKDKEASQVDKQGNYEDTSQVDKQGQDEQASHVDKQGTDEGSFRSSQQVTIGSSPTQNAVRKAVVAPSSTLFSTEAEGNSSRSYHRRHSHRYDQVSSRYKRHTAGVV